MRGATCFSGIGAPEVAMPWVDWVWHSEIEPFPCAVMAHRHPSNTNLGDVLAPDFIERAKALGPLDIMVGGPPCQSFSIAGLRGSLSDPRGNLTLRWVQVLHAIRPSIAITENVPGWLSTSDNAFGCFLAGIVGADAPLNSPYERGRWPNHGMVAGPLARAAWRVLDAQYVRTRSFPWAVPQRRRRVFVVISFGASGIDPAAVLFDRQSMFGNPAPRRETGQGIAADAQSGAASGGRHLSSAFRWQNEQAGIVEDDCAASLRAKGTTTDERSVGAYVAQGGRLGTDFDCDGGLIAGTEWPASVAPTLNAHFGEKQGLEDQHIRGGAAYSSPAVANPLTARMHKGINTTADEGQTPIITHGGGFDGANVAHALRGEGFDASKDGTGRGTPLVPVAIHSDAIGRDGISKTAGADAAGVVRKRNAGMGIADDGSMYSLTTGHPHAIAIQERAVSENPDAGPDGKGWRDDGAAYTLEARSVTQSVAFCQNTCDEVRLFGDDGQTVGALSAEPGMKQTCYVAFTAKDHGGDAVEGISPTLRAGGHSSSHANAGVMPAIAFKPGSSADARSIGAQEEVACTLEGGGGGNNRQGIAAEWGVRRLTPTECARLQGFPDDWARIPWRGKAAEDCPDGPQYKAYGNSMACNVVGWIGDRIQTVMGEQG